MTSPGKHQALFKPPLSIHAKPKAAFPIERSEGPVSAYAVEKLVGDLLLGGTMEWPSGNFLPV